MAGAAAAALTRGSKSETERARAPPETAKSEPRRTRSPVIDRSRSPLLAAAPDGSRRVQASLKISQPGDAAEREAETTARAVMAMRDADLEPRARGPHIVARAPAGPAPRPDETSPELTVAIRSQLGGGGSLPQETRRFMQKRFGADFGGVRIHTGGKAQNLATRLGANAFTYGRDIFFNAGQFQPDSEAGMELIAHELTHTIQQREVVQRQVQVSQRTGPQVQRGLISEALDWIADKANYIPGFRLFTIVIGVNPINMSRVERSGANILRAMIEFVPGGGLIVDAFNNHGLFEKGGKFIEDQFRALGMVGSAFRDALMEFLDSLGWRDLFRLGSVWDRAKRIFTAPVDRLISFAKGLVTGIAELIKDAIIKPLGRWAASNIPKWNLLVAVFGKNPISDEGESPASAIIGAFMELIGQQEIWENIKKGNAVARAWTWFQTAMKGALSLVTSIPGRVMGVIRSLTIVDIVTIAGAFTKIVGAFASFVGDFGRWALGTVLNLLEIIFSVVAPSVIPYLKKAGSAFSTIIKAPGRFISTLVRAGRQGFNQFKTNIVRHLRDALFKWLLGGAEGAGIYFPKSFAPLELLKMGLSVLGLTWANLRGKLVAATNETVVKALETGFDLVVTLVKEGPAAAWRQLLESLSNLKTMVVDAAIDFVKGEVVKIAIEKLVSFLTPAGAFIQAIIAIYRTISFIVSKLAEIGRLVAAFIDSISALANGVVAAAANKVESVLATGLSLAISFLANFAGLGNIPKKVMEIIKKIRAPVDKAMDKAVAWVVGQARKLGKMAKQGASMLIDWWKEKLGFTNKDGESHTLQFIGGDDNAKMGIATTLQPVRTYLDNHPDKGSPEWNTANSIFNAAMQVIYSPALKTQAEKDRRAAVKAQLAKVSSAFAKLAGEPPADADYGSNTDPTYGNPAKVDVIVGTPKAGSITGAWPINKKGYKEIYDAGLTTATDRWVQMHIISEKIGGDGTNFANLVPAPNSVNTGPFRSFEHAIPPLAKAKSGKIKNRVWVEVSISGSKTAATGISGKAGLYLWKGKKASPKWIKSETPSFTASAGIPVPQLSATRKLVVNFTSATEMTRDFGISSAAAALCKQGRPYTSMAQFARDMISRGGTAAQVAAFVSRGAVLNGP